MNRNILYYLGLINTHVHTSQQLARGIADDVDLLTWLHHRIWPYESNMTEEDSYISTLLCGIELIHSGVSTAVLIRYYASMGVIVSYMELVIHGRIKGLKLLNEDFLTFIHLVFVISTIIVHVLI